jgi:hypothetical protein
MSSGGKAGNGRVNKKRQFKRRNNDAWSEKDPSGQTSGGEPRSGRAQTGTSTKGNNPYHKRGSENVRGERTSHAERPKWIPPKINTEPLPVSDCPWCGKPIRDISSAITDKDTGNPVHFDCVTARISFGEKLEKGESVAYIGGGRFGIVSFGSPGASAAADRNFTIKKIIEWENNDKKAEWRSAISDHYSVT